MLKNISYKNLFVSLIIIFSLIITFIVYLVFSNIKNIHIDKLSKDTYNSEKIHIKSFVKEYFDVYNNLLITLSNTKEIIEYENNIEIIEKIFNSYEKTLPNLVEIIYLDKNQNEIIKVNKVYESIKEDYTFFNSLDKSLKAHLTNQKIYLGQNIFKENKKISTLILKIDIKEFISKLVSSSLYNLTLVNKGKPILNKENLTLSKEEFSLILNNEEYLSNNLYSFSINDFYNQNIKIVLKPKHTLDDEKLKESQAMIFLILFFSFLILIPLAMYFSNIPNKILKEYEDKLITHNITGLKNSIYLDKELNNKTFNNSIIILVYLNNFKKLQSVYGYKIINTILKESSRLIESYKHIDENFEELYSIENNLFAIKYNFTNEANLIKFTQLLFTDLERVEILIDKNSSIYLDLTLAISNPLDVKNNAQKLHEAQMALEYALENKIDILVYDPEVKTKDINSLNLKILKSIKNAIDKNDLVLHYQPIYNNRTQKIEKYETLMRIKNSNNEIIYPNSFLDIAKNSRKYNKLTYAMIEKSFKYFQNKEYEFSINLSVLDIVEKGFTAFLVQKIKEYNVEKKLVLEIVESESVTNYKEIKKFIIAIKELGCKIAIDDFGSGYANFQHIISLSQYIDYIKFDGSLIKNIHKNRKSQLLVGVIKFLCDSLNIQTIAEFVEDEDTLNFVDSMGINFSQGYFIGKPIENI